VQHAQALSYLFCDKPHKIPGVVDNPRNPVDNPAVLRACIAMHYSAYLFLCLIFRKYFFLLRTGCAALLRRNS